MVCCICMKIVDKDHDCEVAKKMAANPIKLDAPFVHGDAVPSRDLKKATK